jgi:prolyl oligopeptidase
LNISDAIMPQSAQDPFLWLEDSRSAATQAWVAEQNAHTELALEQDPRFATLRADILQNMQNTAQIPLFSVHGGCLYNFHQSSSYPRGVYRRTTLESYVSSQPEWQIVFNLDALAAAEQMDWYLAGVDHCTLAPHRCLLSLNIGGSDACVIREYDVQACEFVTDGFEFPLSRSQVSWRDLDSVFVCPAWDEDQQTTAGFSAEVVLYRRGQAWHEAASMLVLPPDILKVAAWRFLDVDASALDLVEVARDFHRRSYFLLDAEAGEAAEPVYLPISARGIIEAYTQGQLIIRLNAAWTYQFADQSQIFTAGSLIALQCDRRSGELGAAQLIFQPNAQQSLQMVEAARSRLLVLILDNVTSRALVYHYQHGAWHSQSHQLPTQGVIELVAQPWQSDALYFLYSHFLQPASLYRVDLAQAAPPQLLRQQIAAFDASDLHVEQCFARSADGTAIPYFIVSNISKELGANTPTLLYGYGGFAVPLLPYYLDNLGPHWLKPGYRYVLANIRGGGEFGPEWHLAASAKDRQRSFDDFIAVAEDLIERGLTSPAKLAIQGGSNGGLLVANCMLQRPDLFGAVVCEVPLLDMLRFTDLGVGASWVAEFGDPQRAEDLPHLQVYSAYHNLNCASEQHYPRVYLSASSNDDRTHPAHARKMAARLQVLGHAAYLSESAAGGHQGLTQQSQTAADLARILVFLQQTIVAASE